MASVAMTFLALVGVVKIEKKPYWKIWKVALFQPIMYFIFETNGLKYASSSEAGMLIAMIPIVVVLLSPMLLKEKIKWYQVFFAFMSFTGVAFIVGGGLDVSNTLLGKLLVLGAVFSAAFYNIFSRKLSKEFRPEEITFFMMITGFLFFTALSVFSGQFVLRLQPSVVFGALYLGLLSSTVAFFLVNYMLSKISPTISSLFSNLTTVVSVLAGSIIRKEVVTGVQILGMILILLALTGNSFVRAKKIEE